MVGTEICVIERMHEIRQKFVDMNSRSEKSGYSLYPKIPIHLTHSGSDKEKEPFLSKRLFAL